MTTADLGNATAAVSAGFRPTEAHTLEETGLSHSLVLDLVLKYVFFEGTTTLARLIRRSKLSPAIIQLMYRHLQKEQLCDARPMVGEDYQISLNGRGRNLAEVALKKSQYVGPAPVSLADYDRAASAQGAHLRLTAATLRSALEDLVLADRVINELGAALMTGGTILLFGTTGNGKTSVAERLHRLFTDFIYVPYAVEVAGHVVMVFDPLVHHPGGEEEECPDPRWVLCRRPMVKVGGEMSAAMLEARIDDVTRICTAPIQMKANNGVLLIDDFGRQRIAPRELLNRWIVPLDRRRDILSLWSGINFEVPFELLVVFATNLSLSDLAEDAFMRRLHNKIKIDPLSEDLFRVLLRRTWKEKALESTPEMEDYIVAQCAGRSPEGFRACFPRDLTTIINGIAAFEQRPPRLEKDSIDGAVRIYFAS